MPKTRKLYASDNPQVLWWFLDTFKRNGGGVTDDPYYSGYHDSLFWNGTELMIQKEIFDTYEYSPDGRKFYMMGWYDAQGDLDEIAVRFNGKVRVEYR